MLLLSLLIFYIVKAFKQDNTKKINKYVYISGFILGYIALTKLIFGQVLMIMLLGVGLLWIINRTKINYQKAIIVMLIAFATTIPYLIYTYKMTNKMLYWGTGYDNLYWMSTPYKDEYGDWKGELTLNTIEMGNYNIPGADDTLRAHHQTDYDEIYKYTGLERDEMYKKIAVSNIKSHPLKYAQNIFFNIGRIFFHYPFSYANQRPKPLFVMPLNGIILTLMLICLIPTLINWRKLFFPIRFLLFFVLLYLGTSSLVSAETRMFAVIVPVLLFWIAVIIHKSAKNQFKV